MRKLVVDAYKGRFVYITTPGVGRFGARLTIVQKICEI